MRNNNKSKPSQLSKESGSAYAATVFLILLSLLLGLSLIFTSHMDAKITKNYVTSLDALYVAEAGLAHGISYIQNNHTRENNVLAQILANGGVFPFGEEYDMDSNRKYCVRIYTSFDEDEEAEWYAISMDEDEDEMGEFWGDDTVSVYIESEGLVLYDTGNRYSTRNLRATAQVSTYFTPQTAIIAANDLEIAGSPSISGDYGSIHVNGDLVISGDPTIEISATSSDPYGTSPPSGVQITGSPTIAGEAIDSSEERTVYSSNQSGYLDAELPSFSPEDFEGMADYTLNSLGFVLDSTDTVVGSVNWMGWEYVSTASPPFWQTSSDTPEGGVLYFETSVLIDDNPGFGADAWEASIISEESIELSGKANMKLTEKTHNVLLLAGKDILIWGDSDQNLPGLIGTREQIQISGPANIHGVILALDAASDSSLVEDSVIYGDPVITYEGFSLPLYSSTKMAILGMMEVRDRN